jgi:hypothetical protein
MEELQDAIEDAQYVNAIANQEDGPRPVLPWETPTDEQRNKWEAANPDAHTLEWVLHQPIGFFLFSQYVKQTEYLRINFCEEVIRFKKLRGKERMKKANHLLQDYLQPCTIDNVDHIAKTEIEEYDLARPLPARSLQEEEVKKLVTVNMDYPICSESAVGLKGPVRAEVFDDFKLAQENDKMSLKHESMRDVRPLGSFSGHSLLSTEREESPTATTDDVEESQHDSKSKDLSGDSAHSNVSLVKERAAPSRASSTHETKAKRMASSISEPSGGSNQNLTQRLKSLRSRQVPHNVFEKAEQVVMESLRNDYWSSFIAEENGLFVKFKNFMWYQDRTVIPDDFFVMRVLGRGGFGLVTGTYCWVRLAVLTIFLI